MNNETITITGSSTTENVVPIIPAIEDKISKLQKITRITFLIL